jgi:hypothetical protein
VLRVGSSTKFQLLSLFDIVGPFLGANKELGGASQFDSLPLEVRNQPDFLAFRWRATHRWKVLNEGCNFALDFIGIGDIHAKLWAPKVARVLIARISGLPLGSPGTKCHLDVAHAGRCIIYYKMEGGGFPKSGPW